MIESAEMCNVLGIEIVGRARDSDADLSRSMAILEELVESTSTYESAQALGKLLPYAIEGGVFVLFWEDQTAPVRCALELSETFKELPSMSVRMAIHSGPVHFDDSAAASTKPSGDGIDATMDLIQKGAKGQILLSESYADSLNQNVGFNDQIRVVPQKLFFLDAGESSTTEIVDALESALSQDGHEIANERSEERGVAWAKSVEARIRSADMVVAVVPGTAGDNELLQYELEIAIDERMKRGSPQILPVWLDGGPVPDGPLGVLYQNLLQAQSQTSEDFERVVSEVRAALTLGQSETEPTRLTSPSGASNRDQRLYIRRHGDAEFEQALEDRESIILVKGPRQIGKTSLIGRGTEIVERSGWRCAFTDFQKLSSRQMESAAEFHRVVAVTLAQQLGVEYDFDSEWLESMGPNLAMDSFMRTLLEASPEPLIWFIDEADRLFATPFGADFYGLVRSWHNARATNRRGPWARLTVVIGYATEAHLFIKDLHQSPFNVGVNIDLEMFTLENVVDLNERHGKPIGTRVELESLHLLLGGHPYLTRRAFDVLARGRLDFQSLIATAPMDEGPFGDHLKRLLLSVTQLPKVMEALIQSLSSPTIKDSDGLHRLVAAGVLIRKSNQSYELPNDLYRRYLGSHLKR